MSFVYKSETASPSPPSSTYKDRQRKNEDRPWVIARREREANIEKRNAEIAALHARPAGHPLGTVRDPIVGFDMSAIAPPSQFWYFDESTMRFETRPYRWPTLQQLQGGY